MQKKITSTSFFIGKGDGNLISFGSGQPDLPPPKQIYRILKHYRGFKYGLIQGEENLRQALSKDYLKAKPEDFVITNGASEALDLVLRTISKRGGKVLLPRPYYYSYPFVVRYAGMTPIYYDLNDGKIDLDNLKKRIKGCLAILINSPSNPTGAVQEISVLKNIELLAARQGVYVISDEVYKDLIYVRKNYLIQGPKVVTINSFSKTYALCGLRVGYLYSKNKNIVDSIIEMKTHASMNTSIVGQTMAYEATRVPRSIIAKQVKIWESRRNIIYSGMVDLGLDLRKPEGAFYVFPKFKNPDKVMHDLYYKYHMITYNGAWFGDSSRLRFSYALDESKIKEGLRRLKIFLLKEYQCY